MKVYDAKVNVFGAKSFWSFECHSKKMKNFETFANQYSSQTT
jgi:hypothetical protein